MDLHGKTYRHKISSNVQLADGSRQDSVREKGGSESGADPMEDANLTEEEELDKTLLCWINSCEDIVPKSKSGNNGIEVTCEVEDNELETMLEYI